MKIRIYHALAVLLILAVLTACSKPSVTHRLELYDESGTVIATVLVVFPTSLPASGQSFEGTWQVQSHLRTFPISAVHPGRYLGLQRDGKRLLDLNPDIADNNVVLEASLPIKPMAGRWRLATAAGFPPGGKFRLQR